MKPRGLPRGDSLLAANANPRINLYPDTLKLFVLGPTLDYSGLQSIEEPMGTVS